MAKKHVRVTLNKKGVRELLRSAEMMQICAEHANRALQSLGDGYEVTTRTGKNRVNAEVRANTRRTLIDNARNNTILKAIGGGGK